jgi:asparagine synthetase A
MRYVLISFDNLNVPIFTSMTNIKRDVIEKNGEVMVSFNYYIEYHLMTEINHDTQNISLLKNILMMIDAINQNEKFKDVKFSKYIIEKINFISIFELKKKYPTLALKESLNRYVSTNGLTFINGVYERLPNDEHLLVGSPTSDDYHRSGILYVFNKITNSIIPIIKITTRPNQDLIQKQIILDIPNELEEQIYQNTVLNDQIHFLPSIGIQIYFSNLMLINLSKMHLCEVIHSPFSPELLKYFRENEIEVM